MKQNSRRNFLKVSALAGGGLMIGITVNGISAGHEVFNGEGISLNHFLSIDSSGKITFMLTKHEMGQGSGTGLPMILADELEADWDKLHIKRVDYSSDYSEREMGTTGGSSTIAKMWDVLRQAGAGARELLKQAAAAQFNTSVSNLKAENSFVINTLTGDKLEYGQLAAAAATLTLPKDIPLKKTVEFKYIGKPIKNKITHDVIMGTGNYGINSEVPGMVYAAIVRCPVYKGKVSTINDTDARKINGVIDVVKVPQLEGASSENHVQAGVAVIAKNTWAALKAKKLLKITWDEGELKNASLASLDKSMQESIKEDKKAVYDKGDIEDAFSDDENELIEAVYDNPYQAHALMEPINATVYYKGDTCEVWGGTQSGSRTTTEVAKIAGLPKDKVTTHVLNSGGSFGRRYYMDAVMEATYLSKHLNKPVKLTWSREDEVSHDYYHPYQRNYYKAAIDKDKKIIAWQNTILRTEEYFSGAQPWEIPYHFPNIRTFSSYIPSIVHTGAWRSVAEHSRSLGKECFIDELANKTDKDPLAFRKELLTPEIKKIGNDDFAERVFQYRKKIRERYTSIIDYIAEKNLWNPATEARKGVGVAFESFGRTVCAHIAHVTVNGKAYKVDKITSVINCGIVVNPHFAEGQVEGGIIWALTAIKYGGIEVENGRVQRSNFHDNRVLRIDEVPAFDVHFVKSEEAPTGLGEPAVPPVAPAVLNAIYHATGKRYRKLPLPQLS